MFPLVQQVAAIVQRTCDDVVAMADPEYGSENHELDRDARVQQAVADIFAVLNHPKGDEHPSTCCTASAAVYVFPGGSDA